MVSDGGQLIRNAILRGLRPPDLTRPVWDWVAENVIMDETSNWRGQNWSPELTPFVKKPMEDYVSDEIQSLTCMASAQSAKTQPIMGCICWSIVHDPAPTLWVSSTEGVLTIFAKGRMQPTLQKCKPVSEKMSDMPRSDKGTFTVYFPNMLLALTSSESNAELQSTPYKRVILDEARKYKPENFGMVMKRTRTFQSNKMEVILSCPEDEDDHVHQGYKAGDQNEWHFCCLECGMEQPYKWRIKDEKGDIIGGVVYDSMALRNPAGMVDENKLVETIRYQCPFCKQQFRDNPWLRRHVLDNGFWKPMNPFAISTNKSYHWAAILPPWVSYQSLVLEFIKAQRALRAGDNKPLFEFIRESLGEPVRPADAYEVDSLTVRDSDYRMGDKWEDEEYRFMTIDVQKGHFWVVIRQWASDGRSRLLFEGGGMPDMPGTVRPIISYEDLLDIQDRYKVPNNNVCIDVSHWQTEICRVICKFYEESVQSTWLGFQGVNQKDFLHRLEKTHETVRRIYSSETLIDAWIGTADARKYQPVPYYMFADESAKNRMEALRKAGYMTIAGDASPEYIRQIDAEIRIPEINPRTHRTELKWVKMGKRPNHLFDCEKMQVVMASMAYLIGNERFDHENEKREDQQAA